MTRNERIEEAARAVLSDIYARMSWRTITIDGIEVQVDFCVLHPRHIDRVTKLCREIIDEAVKGR